MTEPIDTPAEVYDRLERVLGEWPQVVREHDHEQGAWLDQPVGAIVFTNQRFVTREGHLLFHGVPRRRVP